MSGLLVDVGLERVGLGLHRRDSLQDFLLWEKVSHGLKFLDQAESPWRSAGLTWMATPKSFPSSILGMRC